MTFKLIMKDFNFYYQLFNTNIGENRTAMIKKKLLLKIFAPVKLSDK